METFTLSCSLLEDFTLLKIYIPDVLLASEMKVVLAHNRGKNKLQAAL